MTRSRPWRGLGRAPSTLQHVRTQAHFAGAVQFAGMVLRYGTAVLIARLAGAGGLGLYVLVLALGALTRVVAVLGLDRAVVRFLADADGRSDASAAAGVVMFCCTAVTIASVVLAGALFILAPALARMWHEPHLVGGVRVMAVALPLAAVGQVSRAGLRALRDVRLSEALEQLAIPIATALAVLGLRVTPLDHALLGVVAAAGASGAVGLVSWALLVRLVPTTSTRGYSPRQWTTFSIPAWIEGALLLLVGRAGYLFLARYADTEAVGVYGAALSVAALVGLPLAAVNTIFGPTVAHLYGRGEEMPLQELYARLTWGLMAVGVVVVALVGALSGPVLAAFGSQFDRDRGPLLVLLGWQLVNLATGPSGPILMMTGRIGWKLTNAVVTVALTLVLSWLLVPRMGSLGAAIALAASTSCMNVVQVVQVRALLGLWAYDRSVLPSRPYRVRRGRAPLPPPTRTRHDPVPTQTSARPSRPQDERAAPIPVPSRTDEPRPRTGTDPAGGNGRVWPRGL